MTVFPSSTATVPPDLGAWKSYVADDYYLSKNEVLGLIAEVERLRGAAQRPTDRGELVNEIAARSPGVPKATIRKLLESDGAHPTQGGDKGEAVAWQKRADEMIMSLGCIKLGVIDQIELRAAFLKLMTWAAAPQPATNAYTAWQPIETAPNSDNFRFYGLYVTNNKTGSRWFEAHYLSQNDDGQLVLSSGDNFDDWAYSDFEYWAPGPALPSTHLSPPAATIGDIPSEPRPPASAAMGLSAGGVTRCEVCDWPLAESREKGCVSGDCSYRPEDPVEQARIRRRRAQLTSTPQNTGAK